MPVAPFNDITATNTRLHSWMYETLVAPAVYGSRAVIDERFLAHLPSGAHILDVGSGGALFTKYIADQRPDVHIVRPRPVRPPRSSAPANACALTPIVSASNWVTRPSYPSPTAPSMV